MKSALVRLELPIERKPKVRAADRERRLQRHHDPNHVAGPVNGPDVWRLSEGEANANAKSHCENDQSHFARLHGKYPPSFRVRLLFSANYIRRFRARKLNNEARYFLGTKPRKQSNQNEAPKRNWIFPNTKHVSGHELRQFPTPDFA